MSTEQVDYVGLLDQTNFAGILQWLLAEFAGALDLEQ